MRPHYHTMPLLDLGGVAPLVAGADLGNSASTLALPASVLTLPSVVGIGDYRHLLTTRRSGGQAAQLASDEHVVTLDGCDYYVGALALREATTATNARGDQQRYHSGHTLLLLLALLSRCYPDQPEIELRLVTGLPLDLFRADGVEQAVIQHLAATHHYHYNGRERVVYLRQVRVLAEGVGALMALGARHDELYGVIDIGSRTTDITAVVNGKPIASRSGSLAVGVGALEDALSNRFMALAGRPLSLSERQQVLHALAHDAPLPALPSRRGAVRLERTEVARLLAPIARAIVSFVATHWTTAETGDIAADIGRVFLIGGGAYYFAAAVRAALATEVVIPAEPETANARGYLAFAQFLQRKGAW